jgi:hypothetical protein
MGAVCRSEESLSSVEIGRARLYPSLKLEEVVPVLDLFRKEQQLRIEPLTLWYERAMNWTPDHLKPRFSSLVDEYRRCGNWDTVRIMEVQCAVSDTSLACLTVKLQHDGERFQVAYCIARYE